MSITSVFCENESSCAMENDIIVQGFLLSEHNLYRCTESVVHCSSFVYHVCYCAMPETIIKCPEEAKNYSDVMEF